jgi:predicted metal-dependent hydrolase
MTPHLPGLTPRPEAEIRPGLEEGLALYRAGFFWEAHEAWEPLWLDAAPNSRERALLQGLIQLANGRLKLRMGRAGAAARIAGLAREHLGRAGEGEVLGIGPGWAWSELARLEAQVIPASGGQGAKNAV